jgi:hypothetical protein
MEQPGDWVRDELNQRAVAESLIEKSRSGRVTGYPEVIRARNPLTGQMKRHLKCPFSPFASLEFRFQPT